ncbi:MAG: hypothetical protein JST59_03725 [Actinobacteria bacterium]|nr:hypothetical protein [Actinomycetota bacterium]
MEARGQLLDDLFKVSPADPTHRLGPITALREIVAVCGSVQTGRGAPNAADRRSLQSDVLLALAAVGDELGRHLEPALKDFRDRELDELPALLDAGGVGRLRAAAETLIELLRLPGAAQAAWRDLFDVEGSSVTVDGMKHLAAVLREIDESLGHEWRWRVRRLRDAAFSESAVEGEEILGASPTSTAKVAWFIFADAELATPKGYLRIGQIQFFSQRLWPAGVTSRDFMAAFPESEFPEELDADALEGWFQVDDSSEFLVYARIELDGPRAEPPRTPQAQMRPAAAWARNLVASVVEAGSFRIGGTHWRLLAGEAVFHNPGGWSGSGDFQDPRLYEQNRRFEHPLVERTGDALEELDPRVADLIAEDDRTATTAVEEARWYEAARAQGDPAQRLVLHVRAFERALPVTRDFHWDDAVSRYLRDFWALEALGEELQRLAHLVHAELRRAAPDGLSKLEQWYVDEPRNAFGIFPGAFMRVADDAYRLLPQARRLARREVRQVARWAGSTNAAAVRIEDWRSRFSVLLKRALRQRNATIHGVTTVPEVVASVDVFIAQIAALVVVEAIHSAGEGGDLVRGLERGRVRSRRMLWRLGEGDGTSDRILFAPEIPG